jgi:hypothetical protein
VSIAIHHCPTVYKTGAREPLHGECTGSPVVGHRAPAFLHWVSANQRIADPLIVPSDWVL